MSAGWKGLEGEGLDERVRRALIRGGYDTVEKCAAEEDWQHFMDLRNFGVFSLAQVREMLRRHGTEPVWAEESERWQAHAEAQDKPPPRPTTPREYETIAMRAGLTRRSYVVFVKVKTWTVQRAWVCDECLKPVSPAQQKEHARRHR